MISLKERLIELLINNKLITVDQLNEAIEVQKQRGGKLSDVIVSLHFIKESDLMLSLSQGLGLPLMDLKRFKIDIEIAKLIPAELARHYQLIPLSTMGDTITVAMADPLNIFAIDHIQSLTGHTINPIIASSQDIIQAIESSYPDQTGGVIDDLVKEMVVSSIEVVKEEKEALPNDQELDRVSREMPVIKITNMILDEATRKRASDILIEPQEKKIRLRFRIDGVLQEQPAPPKSMHASIVSRIKVMSNLDIAEHRLPQDGRFKVKIGNKEVDFRISILPTNIGEKVAIRVLDKSQAKLDIETLGFSETVVGDLKKVGKMPHGMALVCGPTGSGKTTTLYSLLRYVDAPDKNIVSVEDPVEFQMEGINQVTVRPDIGLTFASALRSILRQDPNIIMIGEIRDYDTVDIAIKSALTGHLVIATLHTTTAPGAIVRLMNMGVEPYLIDSSLICAMSQRLVRRVCTYCKTSLEIQKDVLDTMRVRLPAGVKPAFFKGKGCPQCFNSGYSGRICIAEVLMLTPHIRELVLQRAQEHVIKQAARSEGMITLRENGIDLALQGITTVEEVLRVTAPDD
ncbi:MAG TPA: ATPase, T2SS/T4P/T4SS family [Candidatus Omnitrophota bacterium]|nr:ATPase, T2SS/T4P/T4SS family [Candidatus Omnitrophota bacterium]HPT06856.1 ATPase, T2SS/T4P/T4SS family [Candidatus Omnitrophota bacterium]